MQRCMPSLVVAACAVACAGCAVTHIDSEAPAAVRSLDGLSSEADRRAQAMSLYSEGLRRELADDYNAAAGFFLRAIHADPYSELLYRRLAGAYIRLDQRGEAYALMVGLTETYPDSYAAFRWAALLAHIQKDTGASIRYYRKTLDLGPEKAVPYGELAMILYRQDEVKETLRLFKQAARRLPDIEALFSVITEIYATEHRKKEGSRAEAFEDLIRDILKKQEYPRTLTIQAMAGYGQTREYDKLLELYAIGIERHPEEAELYLRAAGTYVVQDRLKEARELLLSALDRAESTLRLRQMLADVNTRLADAAETREAAQEHLEAGIEQWRIMLDSEPGNPGILYSLARTHARLGDYEKAIELFEDIEKNYPDSAAVQRSLVETLVEQGSPEEAIERLEAFAESHTNETRTLLLLGDLLIETGQKDKALERYRQAVEQSPDLMAAYVKLAYALLEEEPEEALGVIEQAKQTLGKEPRLYEMAAYMRVHLKQYDEGIEQFERAEALYENQQMEGRAPLFDLQYILALQKAGRTNSAVERFADAYAENPTLLPVYVQLLQADIESNEWVDATTVLTETAERLPDRPLLLMFAGLLHNLKEEYGRAAELFEQANDKLFLLKDDESEYIARFRFWYGAALERLGRIEEAVEQFERCIEADDEFSEAYNYIAYMWAERGMHLERAMELVEKALSFNPESAAYLDTRGWVYYMKGMLDEAMADLKAALERLPDDPTINEHMGDVYHRLGNREKALEYWRKAMELGPEKPDALQLKIEALEGGSDDPSLQDMSE